MFQTKKFLKTCFIGILFCSFNLLAPFRRLNRTPRLFDLLAEPEKSALKTPRDYYSDAYTEPDESLPRKPGRRMHFPPAKFAADSPQFVVEEFLEQIKKCLAQDHVRHNPDFLKIARQYLTAFQGLRTEDQAKIVVGLDLKDLSSLFHKFSHRYNSYLQDQHTSSEHEAQDAQAQGLVVGFTIGEKERKLGVPSFEASDPHGQGNIVKDIANHLYRGTIVRKDFKAKLRATGNLIANDLKSLSDYTHFIQKFLSGQATSEEQKRLAVVMKHRNIDTGGKIAIPQVADVIEEFNAATFDDQIVIENAYGQELKRLETEICSKIQYWTWLNNSVLSLASGLGDFTLDMFISDVKDKSPDWQSSGPEQFCSALISAYNLHVDRNTHGRGNKAFVDAFILQLYDFAKELPPESLFFAEQVKGVITELGDALDEHKIKLMDAADLDQYDDDRDRNAEIARIDREIDSRQKAIADYTNRLLFRRPSRGRRKLDLGTAFLKAWDNREKIWQQHDEKLAKARQKLEEFWTSGRTVWPTRTRSTRGYEFGEKSLMEQEDQGTEPHSPNDNYGEQATTPLPTELDQSPYESIGTGGSDKSSHTSAPRKPKQAWGPIESSPEAVDNTPDFIDVEPFEESTF